jgi:ABC-2 type transport system ATP-binding protein
MTIQAIEAHGLTRSFGSLVAVDAIDLSVAAGEIFGLLGPNGAGKTTTIRMLITLLKPTAGSAQVAGYDVVKDAQEVRRAIGYVPQLLSADGTLTGYENLLVSARLYHLPQPERRPRIDAALERVGLADVSGHLVREYSGGMIRRLEVAAAMLHRPAVLFLDEPTVGLDPVARDTVWDHIRELRDVEGTTVLLTTHYMEEADELCDRVAIMDHGRIAISGSPEDLKAAIGPNATLDEVFTAHAGRGLDTGGGYRDVARTRRTARRVG